MEKQTEFPSLPDLLYPDAAKREELNRRRLALNNDHPCTYINDLMTESVAGMICRRNPQNVMKLFREMNTDREVIAYRLDAYEDVKSCPKLSPAIHKAVSLLLEADRKAAGAGNPDSFTALSGAVESLDMYISCMEMLHDLYEEVGGSVKSAAFKALFSAMELRYSSKEFASMKQDIADLKEAFSQKIRSVNVAINFNAEMKPISAGIVSWSDKPAGEKPGVFDRLFYRNAAQPDTYVKGKLRTNQPNEDGYVTEADKALFDALEKITSAYIGKLRSALASYDKLSCDSVSWVGDQLDIYDGMVRITDTAEARGLAMCRPEFTDKHGCADIKGLFDPCFFFKAAARSEDKGDDLIVRNDIAMNEDGSFYILTGANNGGKTTFVRGTGLCFLLAQTGFYVPAESCTISPCDFIFTHFPKEEETGINASRFTTEIKDLKTISDLITENSLLLMNESIQSTTPKECADIAAELVRIFCIIGTRGIFATHITELAQMCHEIAADPDCRSVPESIVAMVDESSGKRLYRIEKGAPLKNSYASDIFRSFGISTEEVRKRKAR